MQLSRRATLPLLVALAACSDRGGSTEPDVQELPETATLTVVRGGGAGGVVASSPDGIECGERCTATVPRGTAITLTATPGLGGELAAWSGGGCTGTAPSCTVVLAGDLTVTATFELLRYPVTIALGGSGTGTVTAPAAGIRCPGTCSGTAPHGSALELSAATTAPSLFLGWTVGPGGSACSGAGACTTTITGATTVTATFALQHALEVTRSGTGQGSVTSEPAGIDCGTDCSELYEPGTTVTLTAAPAAGSTFGGWSGGGCAGTGACTVALSEATSVTALFEANHYTLSVIKFGSGGGGVVSQPAGISCGGSCTGTFAHGTVVTLTASPAAFNIFGGWSGGGCSGTGPCTLTLTASTTVGANFQRPIYTLSIVKTGGGSGTVTATPGNINCGGTCSAPLPAGSDVFLSATPASGSVFAGWSGGGCSGTSSCSLQLAGNTAVTATFAPAP